MSIKSTRFNNNQTIYESDGVAFVGGLNTNNSLVSARKGQLRQLKNLNISEAGYLIPRNGLVEQQNITKWVDDFDELIEYKEIYSQIKYTKTENTYRRDVLLSNITSTGNYYLPNSLNNYDFIEFKVNNYVFTLFNYSKIHSFAINGITQVHTEPSSTNDFLKITSLLGTINSIVGYSLSTKSDVETAYTGESKIEFCIYKSIDGKTKVTSRLGQIDGDNISYEPCGEKYTISNKINMISDQYMEIIDNNIIINYEGGLVISRLEQVNNVLQNNFYELTSGNLFGGEPLNINAISVHGFNILNPTGDSLISDKQGSVVNIDGLLVVGKDKNNKISPFQTSKEIILDAIVSYTNTIPLDQMNYRWSYTYIGNSYLDNNLINELKKNEGETIINEKYATENKRITFTPTQSGFYRFYCTLLTDEQIDEEGNSKPDLFILPTRRSLIDIEFTSTKSNQPDELIMYQSIKKSKVMRRWNNYFVYVGGENTSYANTLFFSLPNDPTYVPTTFVVPVDREKIVDLVIYREQLLILTEENIYRLDGDCPTSIASAQTMGNRLQPFNVKRILSGVGLSSRKNVVAGEDIYIQAIDGIRRVYYTSGNILKSKIISNEIANTITNLSFSEIYNFGKYIVFVKDFHMFLYEPLPYNEITGDGRWLYHHYTTQLTNIYSDKNNLYVGCKNGIIGMFSSIHKGYDFGQKITMLFKTQPQYFENKKHYKRIKSVMLEISPFVQVDDTNEALESKNSLEKFTDKQGLGKLCLDIFIDDKHIITSKEQKIISKTGEQFPIMGDMLFVNEKVSNLEVKTKEFTLTAKDNNKFFGSKLKGLTSLSTGSIYEGTGQSDVDYIQEVRLSKARGRGIQIEMEFELPHIIKDISYIYSTTKVASDSSTRIKRKGM